MTDQAPPPGGTPSTRARRPCRTATGGTRFDLARVYLEVGARWAAAATTRQVREVLPRRGSADAEAVAVRLAERESRPPAEPTGPRRR